MCSINVSHSQLIWTVIIWYMLVRSFICFFPLFISEHYSILLLTVCTARTTLVQAHAKLSQFQNAGHSEPIVTGLLIGAKKCSPG